ncbi:hypothetical protein, partial [Staphylococcus aureus]
LLTVPPHKDPYLLPLDYPPGWQFYDIQESFDLTNYHTILRNCYGPATTNPLAIYATNPKAFYRVRGHDALE